MIQGDGSDDPQFLYRNGGLNMKLLRAAEILIEKIKKDYKDDIAVVVVMGSYIYNETHSRSDLDMYYVPKSERGKNLGKVFIIDGIGFDFWPISWERLEGIANHDEKITSIVTEGRVIYCSSEEDLARFNQLKEKGLDTSDRGKFIRKAQEKFNETYKAYFKMVNAENLSEVRIYAMEIIFSVTYAIALLNRTTVKRGRGKLKKEIMDMSLVPKDFSALYDTVFVSGDIIEIKNAYRQLMCNTEDLISNEQNRIKEHVSFADKLDGFYEELINFYNKIIHACEIGDTYTALFAAVEITHEVEAVFSGTGVSSKQLPDIVGAFDLVNMKGFLEAVHEHQKQLVELLQNNSVKLRVLQDFEELEQYMQSL
jgi:hypothetical protein